jgi:outer membrane protein
MKFAAAPAIVALIAALGVTGTARAEDLLQVYRDALANDPQIREADANRRAAREARPQAWAALLPQINGTAQISRGDENLFRSGPTVFTDRETGQSVLVQFENETDTEPETEQWSLELRQNVFSWANWAALRRSGHEVAQAEADYRAAAQNLLVRVAEAYFNVLAARDNLDAEQAALEAISRQLEQAEKRFEVGLIAITDVQDARAARDTASANVIAAKRSLATAEELLREITGKKYESLVKPTSAMPLKTPEPADESRWVEAALNQNLELQSTRLAADIARENVRAAFGGHLPTIDFVASRNHFREESTSDFAPVPDIGFEGGSGPSIMDRDDTTYSLQFRVPIFSSGGTRSRVREQEYRWLAAKERVVRISRQTERAARDAYLGVISEISRVNALRQALESSETSLRATEAGYEVGTRTAVDVLDARRQLVAAQTNYARSRYDYILNVIRLRNAAGDLDEKTIQEVNDWISVPGPPATPRQP